MRAVAFARHGDESVLFMVELPLPEPGAGEVRVAIRAAGVNHLDLDLREGTSRYDLTLPHILGRESAGVIDAVGDDVTKRQVGERVVVATSVPCRMCRWCIAGHENLCPFAVRPGVSMQGGYAEATVVPAEAAIPIGDLPFDQAAALAVSFGTAWRMLVSLAEVRPGESVLVTGAAGALGIAGVQVAALAGARVLAAASSDEKVRVAESQGAEVGINYRDEDLVAAILRATCGCGVDIAFEHVGGETLKAALRCTAEGGRLVCAGAHAGEVVSVDLVELFRGERRLLGSRGQQRCELEAVVDLARRNALRPLVGATFPLDRAADAHRLVAARRSIGKVVLHP